MRGKISIFTIGILASVTFLSNIDPTIASPLQVYKLQTATTKKDNPNVGAKTRKEVQAIQKAIAKRYTDLNNENYDPRTSTGGCGYYEVNDLQLDSLTQERAELTMIYTRYNCGLHGGANLLKGSYLYEVHDVDVFREKLTVIKQNGVWKAGN